MGWDFAVPDWWERLRDGRSLLPDLPLDRDAADLAVRLFNQLRLPDVAGQPTLEEAAGDWFRDIVRAVFGSLDPETGVRRVPGVFGLVPKKNSKTTYSGALMLTALLMNRRPNAQFGLFGPTQEVADLAFAAASNTLKATPEFAPLFDIKDYNKTITMRAGAGKGSWLKITTFDMQTATGGKYAGWLLDELHLLGKVPYASRVIGQLRGAAGAIPEQFGIIITTQADDVPAGVFKSELGYARAVRDGRVPEPTVLPILYEFPEAVQGAEDKPWRDPALWPCVLPNLGRSVRLDVLRRDYATAREKGEAEERRWASQHLNVEIGLALHANRWIGADYWIGAAADHDLAAIIARSDCCVAGIDGGGLDDLLGLAVLGRDRETRQWRHWAHAWAQPEVFERRKEIAPALQDLADAGDLTVCRTPGADIVGVADIVERLAEAGLLPEQAAVGLDPYGVAALVDELTARGLTDRQMVAIGQGTRLSPAIWGLERKLKDGTFRHAGQPLMAWCVGNARTEQRGNAVLITKEAAGKSKIDPLVATFNAVMLMARAPVAAGFEYTGI
jgi:phage terminase large subunit-like protein